METLLVALFALGVGLLVAGAISLVVAVPFMWCWNYVAAGVFHAPAFTFSQAFCALLLLGFLKPVASATAKADK